jgi:regulator of protease activity HflC (stomatin/prohibitin superfamily)
MDAALGWIGQIVSWIGQFIPRWLIVRTTHGAVKWVAGKRVVPLGPGLHFWWPVVTEVMLYPVARQSTNLRGQALVTKDDKTILVSGLVVYEVRDIEKLIAQTFDPDDTIEEISLSVINNVLCRKTWRQLRDDHESGKLDKELLHRARLALAPYGVHVLKTTLTDLAPCRVIKLASGAEKVAWSD